MGQPAELAAAARWAIATENKALAATCMQLVGRIPKRERLFSPAELADVVVGEEVGQVRRHLKSVRASVQRALNQNRSFERGKRDRIAAGDDERRRL